MEAWAADYDMASEEARYLFKKVREAERELKFYDRPQINISCVMVDLGETTYDLMAPMCSGVYSSCKREIFYNVEDVFKHFYDEHVKNEQK